MIKSVDENKVNILKVLFLVTLLYGFEFITFIPEYITIDPRLNSILFRAFFLGITILVIVRNKIYNNNKKLGYLLLFWFFYLLRMIYETVFHYDNISMGVFELWTFAVFLSVFPMIAANSNYNEKTFSLAKKVTLILLVLINVLGFMNNTFLLEEQDDLIRADANLSLTSISFGRAASALVMLSFFFYKPKAFINNIIVFGFIFLGGFNLFLAGSRGPLVQLFLFFIIFLIVNFKKVKVSAIFLFLIVFYFLLDIILEYIYIFRPLIERLFNSGFDKNESDSIRSNLLQSGWDQFLNNPIFGDSLETIYLGAYPHNIFVESLMAIGIVGGILMVIIYYKGLKACLIGLKSNKINWISGILIMQYISSLSTGSIITAILFWPLTVLVLNNAKKENQKL